MMQVPYPLAMVLCDAIHEDQWTGRKSILGILTGFYMDMSPLTIPSLTVYVHVSDGLGHQSLSVRIVDADDDIIATSAQRHDIDFTDPLLDFEMGFNFFDLAFEQPGTYHVQLISRGETLRDEVVHERRFIILDRGD